MNLLPEKFVLLKSGQLAFKSVKEIGVRRSYLLRDFFRVARNNFGTSSWPKLPPSGLGVPLIVSAIEHERSRIR